MLAQRRAVGLEDDGIGGLLPSRPPAAFSVASGVLKPSGRLTARPPPGSPRGPNPRLVEQALALSRSAQAVGSGRLQLRTTGAAAGGQAGDDPRIKWKFSPEGGGQGEGGYMHAERA